MSTNIQELYANSVRPLSDAERRQLAGLILAKLPQSAKTNGNPQDEVLEQPPLAAESVAKRQRAIDWIKAHRAEYGGMYVALDGDTLLGAGRNYVETMRAARAAGVEKALVDYLHPADYAGSMGGW
jgi:hypothetical protein